MDTKGYGYESQWYVGGGLRNLSILFRTSGLKPAQLIKGQDNSAQNLVSALVRIELARNLISAESDFKIKLSFSGCRSPPCRPSCEPSRLWHYDNDLSSSTMNLCAV